jgi:histidinol dehydrogenase
MKTFISPPRDFWEELSLRPAFHSGEIESTVRDIFSRVRSEGDRALVFFNQKFGAQPREN